MNAAIVVTTLGVATMGAGAAVAVAAPTDWTGVAAVVAAIGAAIVAVGNVITGVIQAKQKAALDRVEVKIDGGMEKLLNAKVAEAIAKTTLENDARIKAEQAIADAATLKEKARAAATPTAVTPAPVNPETGNVPAAEVKTQEPKA